MGCLCKAYTLQNHGTSGLPLGSESAQGKSLKPSTKKPYWLTVGWFYLKALFGCHDILLLGTSPIKWRQRPDMTIGVDWEVKHQFKQINSQRVISSHLKGRRSSTSEP